MQRFYVTFPLSVDVSITDIEIVHQLTKVMRITLGEHVVLFDGDGSEYEYEIIAITKKAVSLRGRDRRFPNTENEPFVALYQSMPNKMEKIEYILQKGVEVGIRKFVFFRSNHSQKLVLSDAKIRRFISIAREALEQCGGVVMPDIEFLSEISGGYKGPGDARDIVLDTHGSTQNIAKIPQSRVIRLWVGPEGGWSEEERIKMQGNGFIFVRFGERVLRTETAGIVTAFALMHQ